MIDGLMISLKQSIVTMYNDVEKVEFTDQQIRKTIDLVNQLESLFAENFTGLNYNYHFQLDQLTSHDPALMINVFRQISPESEYVKIKVCYSWEKISFSIIEMKIRSDDEILHLMNRLDLIEGLINKG